ncbi:hypothetical protein DPMN_012748 [Dreissena polymorpha]|uniref:Uncharacterized protein n=1 Tax=Dreissena polymorpha TaxID=45954 RepID=A0A9D4N319_DREPO|nr:hypothetical protein DPMN_128667 [Dreissena polymorpha]KAH3888708.1 hypothetical protein DPMN_012748 [Dreissena polymorpha]
MQPTGNIHGVDLPVVGLHTVDVCGAHDVERGAETVEEHGNELDDERHSVHDHEEERDGLQGQLPPVVGVAGQRDADALAHLDGVRVLEIGDGTYLLLLILVIQSSLLIKCGCIPYLDGVCVLEIGDEKRIEEKQSIQGHG